MRVRCPRCQRPDGHCLCAHIPALDSRTRILILQHPRESRHPWNTGRLAALGLRNARLLVGERFDPELWQNPALRHVLLFPGPTAVAPSPSLAPPGDRRHLQLVVPDGTWRKVRGLLSANPSLSALPRIMLADAPPSAYGVRKTREPGAVATVEAIALTLAALEAPTDFSPLLAPLRVLVERQQASMARAEPRTCRKPEHEAGGRRGA